MMPHETSALPLVLDYAPPLDRLLTLGYPEVDDHPPADLTLGLEHVPGLLRMVADERLTAVDAPEAALYARIWAWRALGRMRAAAAVPVLLDQFDDDEDDWARENLPGILAEIGAPALQATIERLADGQRSLWARASHARTLREIAKRNTELRPIAVTTLTQQLARHAEQDQTLNGFFGRRSAGLRCARCLCRDPAGASGRACRRNGVRRPGRRARRTGSAGCAHTTPCAERIVAYGCTVARCLWHAGCGGASPASSFCCAESRASQVGPQRAVSVWKLAEVQEVLHGLRGGRS